MKKAQDMVRWDEEIEGILQKYQDDPEVAHSREDNLLWVFVHTEAELDNPVALQLLALAAETRTRWYA